MRFLLFYSPKPPSQVRILKYYVGIWAFTTRKMQEVELGPFEEQLH